MTTPIDIHDPLLDLCHRLGLDFGWVSRLEFTPSEVEATVYLPNENGAKHIDRDTNEAVTEIRTFKVTT